jgi:hypothetical protein
LGWPAWRPASSWRLAPASCNISWTSSEMKERRSVNSLNGEYGVAVRCLRCSDGSNHPRSWDEPAQPVLWAELSQLVGFSRRIREQFSSLAGVSPAPAPCPLPHSSRTPLACSIRRRSQCAGARLLHGRSASSSVRAQTHTLLAGFFLLARCDRQLLHSFGSRHSAYSWRIPRAHGAAAAFIRRQVLHPGGHLPPQATPRAPLS